MASVGVSFFRCFHQALLHQGGGTEPSLGPELVIWETGGWYP